MKRTRRNIRNKLRKSKRHRGGSDSEEQKQLQKWTQIEEEEEKKKANQLNKLNNFYDLYNMYTLSNNKLFYDKFINLKKYILIVEYIIDDFGDITQDQLRVINNQINNYKNMNIQPSLYNYYSHIIKPIILESKKEQIKKTHRLSKSRK